MLAGRADGGGLADYRNSVEFLRKIGVDEALIEREIDVASCAAFRLVERQGGHIMRVANELLRHGVLEQRQVDSARLRTRKRAPAG